ncbi:anaerobic sulfatase maturase [Acinetobacter sp. GXMZU3951]
MMVNHTDRIAVENISISPQLKLVHTNELYQFHSMVKPSGAQCNIDCEYCFYLYKQDFLNQPKYPRMEASVLELHIRQYIEAQTGPEVVFSWQGGEPTLMGLGFFKQIVAMQQKYKKPNQAIFNDLQTNGLLLDDEWCAFLQQHSFLVGLSIDGPERLHDIYRRTKNDKPTHSLVLKAIELLRQYQIEFNALCVVNNVNAQHPLEVYQYLRDEVRPKMIQFSAGIDPVEPDWMLQPKSALKKEDAAVSSWTVNSQDWGNFLATIWQEWLAKDYGDVFVDQFENVISQLFGFGPQKCTTGQICGKAVAVEFNGDVYSCDHFVYPEFKLGNIRDIHQGDLVFSKKQEKFAYDKYLTLPKYCKRCDFLALCWGECPKNRFTHTPEGEAGLNYLCAGLKIFYRQVVKDQDVLMQYLNNGVA